MQDSSANFGGANSYSFGNGFFDLTSSASQHPHFSQALDKSNTLASFDMNVRAFSQETDTIVQSAKLSLEHGKREERSLSSHKDLSTGSGVSLSTTAGDKTPDMLLNGGTVRRKESDRNGTGKLKEPGGTIATARTIALTKQTHELTGEVGKSDRVDFYRFDLLASSSFNLRIKEDSNRIDMVLLNVSGQVVDEPLYRRGGELGRINRSLAAGTYYVKVTGNGVASSYQMSVSKEVGGSLSNAQLLPITAAPRIWKDSVGGGDRADMYRFDLTGNNTFSLNLKGLKANADVALLNSSGKVVQTSQHFGRKDEAIGATLEAGTYYVKVIGRGRDTDYRLDMAAVPPIKDPRRFLAGDAAKTSGVFTVGSSGEVSFDYLLDGSPSQGELAIFNLKGMNQFEIGSKRYVQEAALRALGNSAASGYVVILDQTEGARFTASAGEPNFNSGEYKGTKTFKMNPGDKFGVMLIPSGTTPDALLKSDFSGDQRPLFSIPAANSEGAIQFTQVVDVVADGNSFAFEDQSLTRNSDFDYDDLIFQVRGAIGNAASLNDVTTNVKDWRNSSAGQQTKTYAADNKYGPLSSIGPELASLFVEYENYIRNDGLPSAFKPKSTALQVQNGYVAIEAIASDDTNKLLTDLKSLGLKNAAAFEPIVSGLLPIEAVKKVAILDSLAFTRPAYTPVTNVGAVDPLGNLQGNRSMNADTARTRFNVDGAGINIGVISDSYDGVPHTWTDMSTNPATVHNPVNVLNDIGTGDLPPNVNVRSDWNPGVDANGKPIATDEGRAMLQLIHDVAPGANLMFHTGYGSSPTSFGDSPPSEGYGSEVFFANAILDLANAGANVIVDDLRTYWEPMFQDGIIAQAINQVVNRGVAYFSSAGNYSDTGYEHSFEATNQLPAALTSVLSAGTIAHDFDPDSTRVNPLQQITIPAGGHFSISLQWDSPFRSASRGSQGATSDLDIYLLDNAGSRILAQRDRNNIRQDAAEVLDFDNPIGSLQTQFSLAVTSPAGNLPPGTLRYQMFDRDHRSPNIFVTPNTFVTSSATVYGHANATGAEAVGAAYYSNTPAFGTSPAIIEGFSSLGTVPILFDTAGNRLPTPEIRQKPEIVAPDGTNTTFFGGDSDSDGFPNFFGSSAAAPHAAAVAALMLQAVPGSSLANIFKALEESALNIGIDGVDTSSGYGLIQADQAIARLRGLETPTVSLTVPDPNASESSDPALFDPGQFVVTRTSTPSTINRDLLVNYTFAGTATNGSDYVESGSNDLPSVRLDGTVLIPAGSTTAIIPITAVDDGIFEQNETLEIAISDNQAYNVNTANRRGTLTIVDNDPPKGAVILTVTDVAPNFSDGSTDLKSEYYAKVTIGNGAMIRFPKISSATSFSPTNWQAVNDQAVGDSDDSIPIIIELYDEDDLSPDDRLDISPLPGGSNQGLGFRYNLRSREIIFPSTYELGEGKDELLLTFKGNEIGNRAEISLKLKFLPTLNT